MRGRARTRSQLTLPVNDFALVVAVLELLRDHPGISDDLREMTEIALVRLMQATEQIKKPPPASSR